MKAYVTTVSLGSLEVQGLMDEKGKYYVSTKQFVELRFQSRQDHASRDLKALLGEGSSLAKLRVENARNDMSAVTLEQFQQVIKALAKKGVPAAEELYDVLFGLSLHQLFSDAFRVKFDKADRQAWLNARSEGKLARRKFTEAIQDWALKEGVVPNYAKYTTLLVKHIGFTFGRDNKTKEELISIDHAERSVVMFIDGGLSPSDAIRKYKSTFLTFEPR